jgi:MFS family permease
VTVLSRRDLRLAAGVVALEFGAAVSTFVASTLLPAVAGALDARDHLGLLLAGSVLGLFVALPLAPLVLHRLGVRRTLLVGLLAYLAGTAVSAAAPDVVVYAAGRFTSGLGGGLLAVLGISAVIRQLDEDLRARVVAASSAMWILPAFVGPPVTLALEHAVGWRWALLAPVPVVLAGRLLVARAAAQAGPDEPAPRPVGRTLLIPAGVALLVTAGWWPVRVVGAAVALAGVGSVLPAGTARLARGAPAALAAMLLFGAGWFGADGLITVLLTDRYGTSVARAAVVLSAAPIAWAVTSLAVPRRVPPSIGLALAAAGVAVAGTGTAYGPGLAAWTLAGVGVGLAYPGLYVRCTTSGRPAEAASAVLTAETFGQLLGTAAGGAVASAAGLVPAYAALAAVLACAALAAARS